MPTKKRAENKKRKWEKSGEGGGGERQVGATGCGRDGNKNRAMGELAKRRKRTTDPTRQEDTRHARAGRREEQGSREYRDGARGVPMVLSR